MKNVSIYFCVPTDVEKPYFGKKEVKEKKDLIIIIRFSQSIKTVISIILIGWLGIIQYWCKHFYTYYVTNPLK